MIEERVSAGSSRCARPSRVRSPVVQGPIATVSPRQKAGSQPSQTEIEPPVEVLLVTAVGALGGEDPDLRLRMVGERVAEGVGCGEQRSALLVAGLAGHEPGGAVHEACGRAALQSVVDEEHGLVDRGLVEEEQGALRLRGVDELRV